MRSLVLVAAMCGTAVAGPAPRAHVTRVDHRPPDEPPSVGPRDAPVTIELFIIPSNPNSTAAYRNLIELQDRHPRRIRLVIRPLERQTQVLAPEAALEAHAQGKFFEFMDAAAEAGRVLHEQDIAAIAAGVGVDMAKVRRAWEDERHEPELEANERRRIHRHGRNTPEMLLNGVPAPRPVGSMGMEELEEAYQDAYGKAQELIAQGVPVALLPHILADEEPQPWVPINLGQIDDPDPTEPPPPAEPFLLRRPLDLRGLPSEGEPTAPVPIVVLCNLRYQSCVRQVQNAVRIAEQFPDEVRVVWHPLYAESAEEVASLDLLHRAALCAEGQGAGWRWVEQALVRTQRSHGRSSDPREEIDEIAGQAEVDRPKLDRCLATGDSLAARRRVRAAVAAGVNHAPAVVVGGRIYMGGLQEVRGLQMLIEDELRPGLLERAVPVPAPAERPRPSDRRDPR